MTIISKTQALQRWDLLTDRLREALWSEANSDFLWNTCASENIPEQMRYTVARISGYVLMGFIHPEDVSKELIDALKIDQRTASDVQAALIGRIFNPLREDIDKVYAPLSKTEMPQPISAKLPTGPKIIQDIGAPAASVPPPGMRPQIPLTSQPPAPKSPSISPNPPPVASFASPNAPSVSMPGLAQAAAATPARSQNGPATGSIAPKPVSVADVGWARTQSSGPVVKLDTSGIPPQAPTAPQAQPHPNANEPTTAHLHSPSGAPMGEIERMTMMKKAPVPVAATQPAPMMLHENTMSQADEKNAGFTIIPKSSANAEIPLPPGRTPNIPRPAVLELGGVPSPGSATSPQAPTRPGDASHVVHYTDFKSPLSSVPTMSSGPRAMNEITAFAPAPNPPAPSQAPQASPVPATAPVPVPPKPPVPPQDPVIVKNFP